MHCCVSCIVVIWNWLLKLSVKEQKLRPKTRMCLKLGDRSEEVMMLTESVIHREELLLISHQDVCAPPEDEIRMVLLANSNRTWDLSIGKSTILHC